LEEQECGGPEEERGQAAGGVERYKRKCGLKGEDSEIVDREFQKKAGIEVAAPRSDGIEA
jgi:hypothetical protein